MSYPTSPTTGATHTLGNKTWTYNGTNWINPASGTYVGDIDAGGNKV